MIPKKSESKYVSALLKILNAPSLLTWQSAMSSIIFGPFRLLGNVHLFSWLFRWPVGVDMCCWSCRPEVRIRQRVCEKIRWISSLLKTFEVRTLSNSNANFVTSLIIITIPICITDLQRCRSCKTTEGRRRPKCGTADRVVVASSAQDAENNLRLVKNGWLLSAHKQTSTQA